jgi:uncharacterized protein (DUF2236 family)
MINILTSALKPAGFRPVSPTKAMWWKIEQNLKALLQHCSNAILKALSPGLHSGVVTP